jgi:hypothetical protein
MAVLSPPEISTDLLTWCPEERIFVAEVSCLPVSPGRVYDDACDVGFTLESARTGRKVVVAEERTERDAEGEILFVDLVPVDARGPVRSPEFRVRVFND